MTLNSESTDPFMSSRQATVSGGLSLVVASSVKPNTPFIGVRLSWLTVARKALFA